jgi:hypothetical protein
VANTSQEALRLYGIVDAESTQGDGRLADGIKMVRFRDLGAVVALTEYTRVRPGERELEDYLQIVDQMYKYGPIVPAPPGTVFHDEGVLCHWMEIHYAKLHEALGVIEQSDGTTPPYDLVRMELGA